MPNQALAMLKTVCQLASNVPATAKLFREGVWAFLIKISWQRGAEICDFAFARIGCLRVITLAAKERERRLQVLEAQEEAEIAQQEEQNGLIQAGSLFQHVL
ncbi:Lsm7 [Symbiodinium sp. KB8]|nr:Lsm7 [Symbiodinium sp. KB8]